MGAERSEVEEWDEKEVTEGEGKKDGKKEVMGMEVRRGGEKRGDTREKSKAIEISGQENETL